MIKANENQLHCFAWWNSFWFGQELLPVFKRHAGTGRRVHWFQLACRHNCSKPRSMVQQACVGHKFVGRQALMFLFYTKSWKETLQVRSLILTKMSLSQRREPRLRTLIDKGRSRVAHLLVDFMRGNEIEVNTIHCNTLIEGLEDSPSLNSQ